MNLTIHPAAKLLPTARPAEREALKADIALNGQREPIVCIGKQIIDGRQRYEICKELEIEPKTEQWDRKGSLTMYVYSRANHRRLDQSQKAASAVEIKHALAKERKGRNISTEDEDAGKKSRDIAGTLFGVSGRYVQHAELIYKQDRKLFERVFNGDMTIPAATGEIRRAMRRTLLAKALRETPADMKDCQLMLGDVVEQLETIPSDSVDEIATDPPYNIGIDYHADPHGDRKPDAEFLNWCALWVAECVRVLRPGGSMFIMMNGVYAARLEIILRTAGMLRRNTIYWWDSFPQNQKGNFSDAVRQIHYFVKPGGAYAWNDDVRVCSRRQVLGDKRGLDAGKIPDNVWLDARLPGNAAEAVPFKDHPPQLPEALVERCVLVASDPGDTILDPFNGNGITGIAALRHGRKYIGIDRSGKYLEQSRKWIATRLAATAAAPAGKGKGK